MRLTHVLALPVVATALAAGASAQCHLQTVVDVGGGKNHAFGGAVDARGDFAVVASSGKAVAAQEDAGSVLVHERGVDGRWEVLQELTAPDAPAVETFGRRLALGSDFLAVLANSNAKFPGPTTPGGLYLFDRAGSTFSFAQKIDLDILVYGDIPASVQVDGDRLAVGFPYDDALGGFVQLYSRGGAATWSLETTVAQPTGLAVDGFGRSVDLDGDLLAIAASPDQIYLYRKLPAGPWVLDQALVVPLCSSGSIVSDLALDGDRLYVSVAVPLATWSPACGQVVAVLRRAGPGQPFLLSEVVAQPAGTEADYFGVDLDAEGGMLLVGSWRPIPAAPAQNGGAFAYADDGAALTLVADLRAPWPHNNFTGAGSDVALTGDVALVGEPNDNSLAPVAGAANFWSIAGVGCPSLAGVPPARSIGYHNAAQSIGHLQHGRQDLLLDAGPAHAGALYLVLGSASDTSPGIPVDGLVVPLVFDAWTALTLTSPNVPPLEATFGTLDGDGRAMAALAPTGALPVALTGTTLHHAFVTLDLVSGPAVTFVSAPQELQFLP